MTDIPDPPPAAMPWYKSSILRGVLTIIVTQVINHAQAQYHFDTQLLGFGVNDVVALIMDMISAGALAYMTHGRVTQKSAPMITVTQATATQINIANPLGAPIHAPIDPSASTAHPPV